MSEENVKKIKETYTEGMRVELEFMEGEKQMTKGLQGTIGWVDDMGQIHVHWDTGGILALITDVDSFHIREQENTLDHIKDHESKMNL